MKFYARTLFAFLMLGTLLGFVAFAFGSPATAAPVTNRIEAPGGSPHSPIPPLVAIVPALAGLSAKELMEKRGELINQAQKIIDKADEEKRDLTDEEDAKFAEIHKDAAEYKTAADAAVAKEKRAAERREQQEQAQEDLNRFQNNFGNHRGSAAGNNPSGTPTPEDQATAIQGWFINNSSRSDVVLEQRHIEAAGRVGLRLNAPELRLRLSDNFNNTRHRLVNALGVGTAGSGGVLQNDSAIDTLEAAMLHYGGILQVADVMRTTTGERTGWPTANDTGNTGRQVGEAKAVTTTDPSFAKVFWDAYKFSSDEVLVSHELLRDAPINLVQVVFAMLGERLGRIQNTKFTVGNGAGTPHGIIPAATVGKTTTSATAITSDELLDLLHSVDKAYRDHPSSGWMFHDNIALALRKLKDSDGRYHWVDGMQAGEADRLFNKFVQINNDMASSIAASAKTVCFGQLNKYKVRQVNTVRVYRLVERHRENDQDAFIAFVESDGNLLDAGGRPVKVMQQNT